MATSFSTAAQGYWLATVGDEPLPELPESSLDAFIELLDCAAGHEGAFELLDVARDPYPGMSVGDTAEPWRLLWAVQLAQLEPFVSPNVPGVTFFVDTVADPSGAHRVYGHADRPEDALEFASITEVLPWMAGQAQRSRGQIDAAALAALTDAHATELADAWEEGASSGMYVLEALLDLPFAEAWDALSRGEWPVVDVLKRPFRDQGKPGWQRAFSLWLIERFLESRVMTLPKGVKASELDAAHRELVRVIASLEDSLHTGLVPELIEETAAGADERLAERARQWIGRYEEWRAAADSLPEDEEEEEETVPNIDPKKLAAALLGAEAPPELPPEETPFTRKLRVVLTHSLDEMVTKEILEVGPEHRDPLITELVEAAADARSAQHLLKQLTRTLVNSDHIEEIYASDDEVSELFRAHMSAT